MTLLGLLAFIADWFVSGIVALALFGVAIFVWRQVHRARLRRQHALSEAFARVQQTHNLEGA